MEIDKSWVLSSFKSNTSQKYECKAGFKQVFKHPVYLAKCRYYLQWCSTALITNFGVSYQRPFLKPTPRSFCSSSDFWQWILIPYGHAVWAPAQAALNIMTWCRLSHQLLKWPNHHLFFLWLKSGRRHIHWWSNQRENKAATCTVLHPMDWTFPKTPPLNSVYSPLFPLIHHQILRILGKGQFSKTKVPLFAHLQSLLSNLFDTMQTATMPGPFPGTFQRDVSPIGPGTGNAIENIPRAQNRQILNSFHCMNSLFYANTGKADCRRNDAPFISKTVWVLDYKWSDMIWNDFLFEECNACWLVALLLYPTFNPFLSQLVSGSNFLLRHAGCRAKLIAPKGRMPLWRKRTSPMGREACTEFLGWWKVIDLVMASRFSKNGYSCIYIYIYLT